MSSDQSQAGREGAEVRIPPPALFLVAVVSHYGAILPEERYLEGKFGDEYASFKASVRRWI